MTSAESGIFRDVVLPVSGWLALTATAFMAIVWLPKAGLERADYVSLTGNVIGVMAAVLLAMHVERRQRTLRSREINQFLTQALDDIQRIADEWEATTTEAKGDPKAWRDRYGDYFARFDDAIAALTPARQLVSPENIVLLSRACRVLAAYDRVEHWRNLTEQRLVEPESNLVSCCIHMMGWDRPGSVAAALRRQA